VADSRLEAWEFMGGGGASFNQLNGRYTVADPAGGTADNAQLLRSLQNLKAFLDSFDLCKMHPDRSLVLSGVSAGAHWRAISEVGKQYALYLHHGKGGRGQFYVAVPGKYHESLLLRLPAGSYNIDWVDPATGAVIRSENLHHQGGLRSFPAPSYTLDLALSIKRG